jgi:predicted NAD/FAD-dependent oxidoreductase
MMFGSKFVFLKALDPACSLPFEVLEIQERGLGLVVCSKVLVAVFQCPYYGKMSSTGNAVIPLCFVQRHAVVSYDTFLPVLYLGEHSSDHEVTWVCVHDEPLSWLGAGEDRDGTQVSL